MRTKILRAAVLGAAFSLHGAAQVDGSTIFVDDSASGSNNGTSWSNSFTDLQSALAASQLGDEIWVAQGQYLPSPALVQSASFHLKDGVAIYGGFAGTESTLEERAGLFDQTVLSGDLLGDDVPDSFQGMSDNSNHVVQAIACGPGTILDGFAVVGGHDPSGIGGGGLRVFGGAPAVRSCRFIGNQTAGFNLENLGGAVYSESANPSFSSCDFLHNRAYRAASVAFNTTSAGGAAYVTGGSPRFADCSFEDNAAIGPYDAMGGAIAVGMLDTSLTVLRCDFVGNQALACCSGPPPLTYPFAWGGAIYGVSLYGADLRAVGCQFLGNVCTGEDSSFGGAVHWRGSPSEENLIAHCVLSGNQAGGGSYGRGAAISGNGLSIEGCIATHNKGPANEAILNSFGAVTNTIVWGNQPKDVLAGNINYSCIEGFAAGGGGVGNIGLDPKFVDPAGVDGMFGTIDDDVRLLPTSPCIDAGSNSAVFHDAFDVDGDGDTLEPTPFDLDGSVRFWDDLSTADTGNGTAPIVDMGAFEFHGDHCQPDLGFQGPGNITLNICGDDLTGIGSGATLQIANAPASSVVFLFAGLASAPTPIAPGSGLLVPLPPLPGFPVLLPTDLSGNFSLPVVGSGNPPLTLFLQALAQNVATVEFSNAIELTVGT